MNLYFWMVVALSAVASISAQPSPCDQEDVDAAQLAEGGIYETSLNPDVDGEAEIQGKILEVLNEDPTLSATAALLDTATADPDFELTQDQVGSTGSATADAFVASTLVSYYRTCPWRYWWLIRYRWYFYTVNPNGVGECCWVLYNWWSVGCGQYYCNVSFRLPWFWYHYHRCFPEYRRVWFWAVCLTVDASGNKTYTKKLIWRYVARGCCCRRYWAYITSLQCPVGAG